MKSKEFENKNRERVLRQFRSNENRSNQGRKPKQQNTSLKVCALAGIVLIILIIYLLW